MDRMECELAEVPGEALRVLLHRAGLTPEQFAGRLNRLAGRLGMAVRLDRKTPYKWLRGGSPRAPWPALAAVVLTELLTAPVTPRDLGWRPRSGGMEFVPASSGLDLTWTAEGAVVAAAALAEIDIMDRRIFLYLTGSALTQPALDWLIAQPAGAIAGTVGRRVQHHHVDDVERLIAGLRRMDDQFGGGTVLELVKGHLRFVIDLLRHHRYDAAVGTRLHGAAAELLRLGGWLSFDSGQHAQAQRYWVVALHSAHAAGDAALGANVLGFMSCQAKDLGLYHEAVRLAEAARRGYPGGSPRVRAILAMRIAEARAQTGDSTGVRTAVDEAYQALETAGGGDPEWSYWLDGAQVDAMAGYCYGRLADWPRAQSHLTAALRAQADGYHREDALRRALLAGAYARAGEPERACEIGGRAVAALADEVDSARCVGHVRRLQDALLPYRTLAPVREFHARVDQAFGRRPPGEAR